eukprot:6834262-Prorocentrum_lima.AAC.1
MGHVCIAVPVAEVRARAPEWPALGGGFDCLACWMERRKVPLVACVSGRECFTDLIRSKNFNGNLI